MLVTSTYRPNVSLSLAILIILSHTSSSNSLITSTTSCTCLVTDTQGRIQDLKKEGAQWLRGLAPNTFLAKLGDFLKNFRQKGVGVRPLPPSGSALDTVGLHLFS